ncbi:MAG: hypothetical protein F6K35_21325 [Okeania sp. SIO2H7]|nr:hypothetical protein [Okeania sp. SIO2H7]
MKIFSFKSVIAASIIAIAANLGISTAARAQPTTFFCGTVGATPATIASQNGNNIPVIIWGANNYFAESGEDALTRCTRVSGILNNSSIQGRLQRVITTGASRNGEPIICAANPQDGSCRLLYRVPRGQNPEGARQELLQRITNPSLGSPAINN